MSKPNTKTPAQQLEETQGLLATANETITDLTAKLEKTTGDLTVANDLAASEKTRADGAEAKVTEMETAAKDAETAHANALQSKDAEIKSLTEKVTGLESAEQDIQKRSSAMLATMCAEMGIAPPLSTGSSAGQPGGKDPVSALTGLEKVVAAFEQQSK